MNRFRLLLAFCCILLTCNSFAQLKFNVKSMPDTDTYGVYVKPCGDVNPSANTITGTAQVTIILPLGHDVNDLTGNAGLWIENATVSGPQESPNKNYITFGFIADSPKIIFESGKETLLFTIESESAVPQLMDNENDPFAVFPNSFNSNPGNEMSVFDVGFGMDSVSYYFYSGNYTDEEEMSCISVVDTVVVEPVDTTGTGGENPTATLDEIMDDEYFALSPNPASQWIKVDFSGKENISQGKIKLWTANGVNIGEMVRNGQSKLKWNVGNLPSGLYFISFESDGRVMQRERFMKQ